jgi:hypothetical protein
MTTASESVFYALHRTIAPGLHYPTGKGLSPAVVFIHHFVDVDMIIGLVD